MRFTAMFALALAACGLGNLEFPPTVILPTAADTPQDIRVLFIGNSLTYVNDLPGVVEAMADSAGLVLHTGSVTAPDYSLGDHLAQGAAQRAIAGGVWDYVVLQQGPSALESSRVVLLADAWRFAGLIRAAGAEPALYQVWPSVARSFDWDRSLESYALAADSVHGVLLRAGSAWRAAWARDPTVALYGADGFHPSPAGTWLAAAVIVNRLTGVAPSLIPRAVRTAQGALVGVGAEVADTLRLAVGDVALPVPAPPR